MTDKDLLELVSKNEYACERIGYQALPTNNKGNVLYDGETYDIAVFGDHNLKNLNSAMQVCAELSIDNKTFLREIASFKGAAKRLELISNKQERKIYKDFAHAPSKVKATAEAVRGKYNKAKISAVLELHTFSSLRMEFIQHYKGTTDTLDELVVFYDPHALVQKGLPPLELNAVKEAFAHPKVTIADTTEQLRKSMQAMGNGHSDVILVMSSGNLGGIDPLSVLEKG